jgi:RimJ/RimL family protein N-acetyltransferase
VITLQTHIHNEQSQRVAVRAGFQPWQAQASNQEASDKMWFILANDTKTAMEEETEA